MKIEIEIPIREQLLEKKFPVPIAKRGTAWSEKCLGSYAKKQGVYMIHHGEQLKYVGKTDSPTMTFGIRLRREFQESASQGKHIYPKLEKLTVPPTIEVSFLPTQEVRGIVKSDSGTLTDTQCVSILETVLVAIWEPEFQKTDNSKKAGIGGGQSDAAKRSQARSRERYRLLKRRAIKEGLWDEINREATRQAELELEAETTRKASEGK